MGAALAVLAVVAHAGINSWTVKGPPGGHALDLEAHTTAPDIFYAMFQRSVHRSTDGGVTWTVLRHFEGQVNALAVDPSDGDRLYVSVYDEGVYRSDDRGESFTLAAPAVSGVWGLGTNATTVYYSGADRRVHRSVDRGGNWTVRGTPEQVFTKIIVDPQNADVLYGVAGPYVLTSTDGGENWTQSTVVASGSVRDIAQLSSNQLVATGAGGVYFSNNSGASWTLVYGGEFIAVAVDPITPGRAVASRWSSGALIETTNYGASWHSFGVSSDGRSEGVAFDSQSPSRIVLLGAQYVRYSTDPTQPWIDATQPPIAHDVSQFATTLASNSKVYAYTNTSRVGGSALFATSGDSGWQRLNLPGAGADTGQAIVAVRPGAPDRIFLGTFNAGVYRSADGGQTWLAPNADLSGLSTQAIAFDPEAPDTLYANVRRISGSGSTSGIYRSTDDGATWAPWSASLSANVLGMDLQIDPANPSHMFLAAWQGIVPGVLGGLYRSTDRGVTWTQTFVGQNARAVAIDPANPSRIYAIVANALQVSEDGGETFNVNNPFAVATNQPAQSVAIDPVVSTVYATTTSSSSYVLRSVDSGQTWEVLRAGTGAGPWRATQLTLDPNTPSLLYVGVAGRGVATFEVAPDLHVDISGHSGTRPRGYESTFNLRAVNNGPYAATRVNVAATLPSDLTNVSISAEGVTCSALSCTVPVLQVGEEFNAVVRYTTPADATLLPVSATISSHENDAAPDDNSAQASANAADPGDLGVTMVPSVTTLTQGGNITYTVTVTNRGPNASNDGDVTFNLESAFTLGALPGGCSAIDGGASCELGAIAVGESRTFTFSAVATNAGAVNASATVAMGPDAADIDAANNSATSLVNATAPPPPNGGNNGNTGGGGGGGGSMNLAALLGGLLLLGGRRFVRGARSI